jgi:hypothetical protein
MNRTIGGCATRRKDYIAQFMFNSPPGISDAMDLAKMLAILKLIEPLEGPSFRIWRQTRTGLLSYPLEPSAARAHLATSVYLQMALEPHIVHVVGYTEADHAATAADVIESCRLARRAIENALQGAPRMADCAEVQQRAESLAAEARLTLDAIRSLAPTDVHDPFCHPATLTRAVRLGILDAPQLKNNPYGRGRIRTQIVDGTCQAVDMDGRPLTEKVRLEKLFSQTDGGKS